MGSVESLMQDALRLRAKNLDGGVKRCFAATSLFSPMPNTFSETAVLSISECKPTHFAQIVEAGLVSPASDCRYWIDPVAAEAGQEFVDATLKARFAAYFAQYVRAHAAEPHALGAEAAHISAAQAFYSTEERLAVAIGMSQLLELRGSYSTWRKLLQEVAAAGATSAEFELQFARCAEKLGLNTEAEEHALRGLQSVSDAASAIRPQLLAVLGHVQMNRGKNESARSNLTQAVGLSEQLRTPASLADSLRSLGVVSTRLSAYQEAEEYLMRAVNIAEQKRDNAALSTLWTDLGKVFEPTGRRHAALDAYQRALIAARQIGYSEKEAAALEGCASVHMYKREFKAANTELQEALQISRRIEHRWYTALILHMLGNLHEDMGMTSEALDCYDAAIGECPSDTPDVRGFALFGKARVYVHLGMRREAAHLGVAALELFEKMPHRTASDIREWMLDQGLTQ